MFKITVQNISKIGEETYLVRFRSGFNYNYSKTIYIIFNYYSILKMIKDDARISIHTMHILCIADA